MKRQIHDVSKSYADRQELELQQRAPREHGSMVGGKATVDPSSLADHRKGAGIHCHCDGNLSDSFEQEHGMVPLDMPVVRQPDVTDLLDCSRKISVRAP